MFLLSAYRWLIGKICRVLWTKLNTKNHLCSLSLLLPYFPFPTLPLVFLTASSRQAELKINTHLNN